MSRLPTSGGKDASILPAFSNSSEDASFGIGDETDSPAKRFMNRVYAYRRLRALFGRYWTLGDLVAFHSREKLLLLAHDQVACRALGRLVAGAGGRPLKAVGDEYEAAFTRGLRMPATRGQHVNVLQHMVGYLKRLLTETERRELDDTIDTYRAGTTPLKIPLTLIRQHISRHDITYLAEQSYLAPHANEPLLY